MMDMKSLFTTYKYDVLKLLGVMGITFLALTIRVDFIGETDAVVQFDYLSATTSIAEDDEAEHDSSFWFDDLCDEYKILCKKTTFNGSFSSVEKTDYFDQISSVVSLIDETARRGSYLENVFTAILINQAKGSRRGSAWWTKLTMNVWGLKYDDEFWQVFTHEVGHIMDLWALQGKSRIKSQNFTEFDKVVFTIDDPSLEYYKYSWVSETVRKNWVKKQDFCSGYGMSNPFEDFAECHNLYLNHHDVFVLFAKTNTSMKNKYNYFANLYGGNYFSNSSLPSDQVKVAQRAWDTTRISE